MKSTRLLLAYGIAAWGAVTPLLLLWLGMEIFRRLAGPGWHYTLFVTTAWHFAALVVMAYVVGAGLLPLYAVFERRRWRGWRYYIPTAILAAFLTEIALDVATTSWVVTTQRARGVGAESAGSILPEVAFALVAGVACGGIFSFVMGLGRRAVRPN